MHILYWLIISIRVLLNNAFILCLGNFLAVRVCIVYRCYRDGGGGDVMALLHSSRRDGVTEFRSKSTSARTFDNELHGVQHGVVDGGDICSASVVCLRLVLREWLINLLRYLRNARIEEGFGDASVVE
ncbi:hypothetical protein QE152_g30449 [Popillia japonica]|uniref:Secreted protein n=1 Tax=Popillia japonica TaxID=7064 RepID=A0AAW1JF13_POPJA